MRLYLRCLHLLLLLTALTAVPVEAAERAPEEVVAGMNASLLEAMKRGKELGYQGRFRLLSPVINDSFAITLTARTAAGRHWASFSDDQRQLYLKTYTEWTVATYAGRFKNFSGERFTPPKDGPPARGIVTVRSMLVPADGEKVEFEYLLKKTGGAWRIIDIRIEGISQLALTRSQFVSVLQKKGFQGLISSLNGKIAKLERDKET